MLQYICGFSKAPWDAVFLEEMPFMLVINNSVVDAYFNLASEEYLLEN